MRNFEDPVRSLFIAKNGKSINDDVNKQNKSTLRTKGGNQINRVYGSKNNDDNSGGNSGCDGDDDDSDDDHDNDDEDDDMVMTMTMMMMIMIRW